MSGLHFVLKPWGEVCLSDFLHFEYQGSTWYVHPDNLSILHLHLLGIYVRQLEAR